MDVEVVEVETIGAFFDLMDPEANAVSVIVCPLQEGLFLRGRNAWQEGRYNVMVPKNQENLEVTFRLLNELVQEEKLLESLCFTTYGGEEGKLVDIVPITRRYGFETYREYPEKRSAAAQHTEIPQDIGFYL